MQNVIRIENGKYIGEGVDTSVIGNLQDLTTTDKSSVVGAINEVNQAAADSIAGTRSSINLAVGEILTISLDAGVQFIAFNNWTDSVNFPGKYGSGWIMKCTDPRDALIIYITTQLSVYVGHRDISEDQVSITWKQVQTIDG